MKQYRWLSGFNLPIPAAISTPVIRNLAVLSALPSRQRQCYVKSSVLRVESKMSDRARYFLNDWFDEHVRPLPAVERLAESVRLATRCRLDATAAGIPLQEIRDMVGGDLIRKILHALDIAATLHDQVPLVPETSALVEG